MQRQRQKTPLLDQGSRHHHVHHLVALLPCRQQSDFFCPTHAIPADGHDITFRQEGWRGSNKDNKEPGQVGCRQTVFCVGSGVRPDNLLDWDTDELGTAGRGQTDGCCGSGAGP